MVDTKLVSPTEALVLGSLEQPASQRQKLKSQGFDMSASASGSVSRFKDAGWQYRGRYADGSQFRKTGFATKSEARQALNALVHEINSGARVVPTRMTVGEWFDIWLKICAESLKQTTAAGYRETVDARLRPHLGHIQLQDLNEDDIRTCYQSLVDSGLSTNTILGAHRRLRKCLRDAQRERKIRHTPADNVVSSKGKPQRKHRIWSLEQLQQFWLHIGSKGTLHCGRSCSLLASVAVNSAA